LNHKDFELSEQIILDFKFPQNKIVYQIQGILNFYHFHISYNPRAVGEKRISIVSSVFTNDSSMLVAEWRHPLIAAKVNII
jgi:hypothetical protein